MMRILPLLVLVLCLLAGCKEKDEQALGISYAPGTDTPPSPHLPDLSSFTVAAIKRELPASRPGTILLAEMRDYPDLAEFLEADAPRTLRLVQKRIHPRAIVVLSGNHTLSQIQKAVADLGAPEALEKSETRHILRMPLLVGADASLTISNRDTSELRLSKTDGAFIATSGNLYILHTTITGWDEKTNAPAWFKDKNDFRPFLTGWSGGKLYIGGSTIRSLGYLKGKSYGVSYSTCVACLKKKPDLPRPTGAIVESRFSDMYYGFYSYEADDVAIVRNVYADNIVYGIDPHDRSRRLIIAENEAYGTKQKHGIIGSREVNDSWIFNNYSHDNHGSGIMLDRTSVNNIVANNTSTRNGADGITFFESQDNISYNNTVLNNGKTGIRVRNSWNVRLQGEQISGNGGPAIHVYTAALEGQETRDFELDPYTQKASAEVLDVLIRTPSKAAAFKVGETIDELKISGLRMMSATRLFSGAPLKEDEETLLRRIREEKTIVRLKPLPREPLSGETRFSCAAPSSPPEKREKDFFSALTWQTHATSK